MTDDTLFFSTVVDDTLPANMVAVHCRPEDADICTKLFERLESRLDGCMNFMDDAVNLIMEMREGDPATAQKLYDELFSIVKVKKDEQTGRFAIAELDFKIENS
jgi:hypothetical protein